MNSRAGNDACSVGSERHALASPQARLGRIDVLALEDVGARSVRSSKRKAEHSDQGRYETARARGEIKKQPRHAELNSCCRRFRALVMS